METIIFIVLAGIAGFILRSLLIFEKKPDGILHIDTSDPETDKYKIQIDTGLEKLPKRKKIVLKINPKAKL